MVPLILGQKHDTTASPRAPTSLAVARNSESTANKVARAHLERTLRSYLLLADYFATDLTGTAVLLAVISASRSPADSTENRIFDAHSSRAVTAYAVATILNVPVETVRRHVNALIARGYLTRISRGVIVAGHAVDALDQQRLADSATTSAWGLIDELEAITSVVSREYVADEDTHDEHGSRLRKFGTHNL